MPSRAERERTQQRRALRLLADAPEGMTGALMMAHGFNSELLVDLCIATFFFGIWGAALRNIAPCFRVQSGLRPANLITLAHFSVSSAMSLQKSAEEPGSVVAPNSASRAFILGSARAALTS